MSRAGRRARRARLVAAGARPPETDADRAAVLLAERGRWVREVGWCGWEREVARRRGERIAVMRRERLERDRRSGKRKRGTPVPSLPRLDKPARARLVDRLTELDETDRLLRQRPAQRPPDAPPTLQELAASAGAA